MVKTVLKTSLFVTSLFLLASCGSTKKVVNETPNKRGGSIPFINPKHENKKNIGKVSVYQVTGLSQITESGKQTAYDQAIEHGLRKAVEEALGVYIDARTKVSQQTLISDKIYARSYGFVQKYEIIRTWEKQSTLYHELKVWVVLSDIEDDILALDLLQDRANKPTLAIGIEEISPQGELTDFAEKTISQKFLAKQFTIVKKQPQNNSNNKINPEEKITSEAFLQFPRFPRFPLEAEILIQGKVIARVNDTSKNKYLKDGSLKSMTTSLNLDVYTVNDAKLIASFTDTLTTIGVNEGSAQQKAVVQLANKVASDFILEIRKKWDKAINNGFEYQVLVDNVSPKDSLSLKNFLKKTQGVKAIFDKGFASNDLVLLARFTGNASELANYLTSSRNPLPLKINYYNSKVISLTKNN